jgi:hypothetical protein
MPLKLESRIDRHLLFIILSLLTLPRAQGLGDLRRASASLGGSDLIHAPPKLSYVHQLLQTYHLGSSCLLRHKIAKPLEGAETLDSAMASECNCKLLDPFIGRQLKCHPLLHRSPIAVGRSRRQ